MPRKFKISITGCGSDCTRVEINDLGFVAVKNGGEVGFTMLIGGGVGKSLPGPKLADHFPIFISSEDVCNIAIATAEIHRDHGNRESKPKARFKNLINDWGIEKFRMILEKKIGKKLENYDGAIFSDEEDHCGVQPQSKEGYHYVNIPLIGGLLTDNKMVILAELAKKYGSGELRLTPQQNIIIPNITEKNELLNDLKRSNFHMDSSKLRCNSIGCASDFCGKTKKPHAKDVVDDIVNYLEARFNHNILDKAGFQIHVSGCPNNCCATKIAGLGLEGVLVKNGDGAKQCYDILLGGGFGKHMRSAKFTESKVPAEELKYKIETLLNNYWKEKHAYESFVEFCKRHTKDELQSYLIKSSE